MIPELAPLFQTHHTKTTGLGVMCEHEKFNLHQPSLYGRSSVASGLEPATRWPRIRDHNCLATVTMKQETGGHID
ncbi:hypothetical protein TNCV_5040611 [Trichonephila clavipes]|nr:hypothetical protein TNCV_5040611 [Trichonephila clavipes]